MLITRKKKVPTHWLFYSQLPLVLAVWAGFAIHMPFLLSIKRFIDNPAAIMVLISLEIYVTTLLGPFCGWISDRIWTRFGRRKPFLVAADLSRGLCLCAMPFAPNLWTLIALRWAYGICSDIAQPALGLVMEVVPPKQRGVAAGFKNMLFNFNNIVFNLLIIGRFHDVDFMGPLAWLSHEISGQTMMFMLGALIFFAAAAFEGLAVKEIKPRYARHLRDLRLPGKSLFRTFVTTMLKDILGKSLLPLYLLMMIQAMFGIGLGIFAPLLYTEQWGYSMQQLGTNVAIGATINIGLAILAGYFADKTSKMKVFTFCMVAGMLTKIGWVIFVANKPDNRPELWEIIVFGEISATFALIAGLVSYPLIMDYVRRDQMGAASAGIGLFRSLINDTLAVFVGFWILWWSGWFMPQAGYSLEVVFREELDKEEVGQLIKPAELPADALYLEPLHRRGVDGELSRRWLIHRANPEVQDLINEKKDISNALASLDAKAANIAASEQTRAKHRARIAEINQRVAAIEDRLNRGVQELSGRVLPVISSQLAEDGSQLRAAAFQDGRLMLAIATIEKPDATMLNAMQDGAAGFQYARVPAPNSDRDSISDLRILPYADHETAGFRAELHFDPAFIALDRALHSISVSQSKRLDITSRLLGILQGQWGWQAGAFHLENVSATRDEADEITLRFEIADVAANGPPLTTDEVSALLDDRQGTAGPAVEVRDGGFAVTLRLGKAPAATATPDALDKRLATLLGGDAYLGTLARETYTSLLHTAEAAPVFLSVPRPVVATHYSDRKYEYFFSGYSIMIVTDIIGLGLIAFILRLERRGIIHRAGVEEDLTR